MSKSAADPFFAKVGKFLGVKPGEILLIQSKILGELTLIGPRPKPTKQIPDIPQVINYCFTFVLKTPPPRALCNAYRQEYNELTALLPELIEAGAWDDVIAIAQRLRELGTLIRNTCQVRERAITYCIFPEDEWFNDPFAGGRTLPPIPPIPPLRKSR